MTKTVIETAGNSVSPEGRPDIKEMNIRVLIIENDPMVADLNRRYVESVSGFEVVGIIPGGTEAAAAALARKPDLILLDVCFPDTDGMEVLREIRRRNLPADMMVVTAARDAATIQEAFRFGVVDYILKPFKAARLISALNAYETLWRSLRRRAAFDQEALDRLTLGKPAHNRQGLLPKGLHAVTLQQILGYLTEQNRALSAEDVAAGVGLARVTARRYLEYLEKSGKAVLELQYGSVGRPVNRYRPRDHKD